MFRVSNDGGQIFEDNINLSNSIDVDFVMLRVTTITTRRAYIQNGLSHNRSSSDFALDSFGTGLVFADP
jgi:hypothetical protein